MRVVRTRCKAAKSQGTAMAHRASSRATEPRASYRAVVDARTAQCMGARAAGATAA